MGSTRAGHQAAYEKWFSRYEIARKKQRIGRGLNVPGAPPRPPGPEDVRIILQDSLRYVGEQRAALLCNVHRTTIKRWLDGTVQIPRAAYDMLRFHAEGVPPGCGDGWRGFSWSGDTLTCPDGRTTLTAFEIAGIGYKHALIDALRERVQQLELQLVEMTARVNWGSANDPYASGQDVRSRAFKNDSL